MAKALNLMNMINEKKEKEAKNNVISKKKNKQAKSSKNNKKKNQTKKIKQNEDSPYETSKKITKKGWHCVQFVVMTFNISFYLLVQNFTYKDIKDKHYSRKANETNKKVHPNTIYTHVNKNAPIPLDAKFISVNKLLEICRKSEQFEELPKEILPNFANQQK